MNYSVSTTNFTFTVDYTTEYNISTDITKVTVNSFTWSYWGYSGYGSSHSAKVSFNGYTVSASGTGVTNGGIKSFSVVPDNNIVNVSHCGGAGDRILSISVSAYNTHYYRITVTSDDEYQSQRYVYKSTNQSVSGSTSVKVGERNRSDLSGDTTGYFGSAVSLEITRYVEDTSVTIVSSCLGRTETIYSGTALEVSWVPNLSTYAALLTDGISAEATITATTYLDGSDIGSSSITTVLTIPESVVPTINNVVLTDAEEYFDSFGAYISGKSKLRLQTSSIGIYGSSIESVSVTIDGANYTGADVTSDILINGTSAARSVAYSVIVTDSRGRASDLTIGTISLYPYSAPALSGVSIDRSDASGTLNDEGGYFKPHWNTPVYSQFPEGQSIAITCDVKAADASSWSSVGAISTGSVFGGSYSANKSYDVRIKITDAVGDSSIYIVPVATATWVMKFRPNGSGVAFGKAAEDDNIFEVEWRARFNNGIDGLPDETDPTVPDYVKTITEEDIAKWNAGGGGDYEVGVPDYSDGTVISSSLSTSFSYTATRPGNVHLIVAGSGCAAYFRISTLNNVLNDHQIRLFTPSTTGAPASTIVSLATDDTIYCSHVANCSWFRAIFVPLKAEVAETVDPSQYHVGDSFVITKSDYCNEDTWLPIGALVDNSAKWYRFMIPLDKKIGSDITNATVNSYAIGFYNEGTFAHKTSGATVTCYVIPKLNCVWCRFVFSSAPAGTSNSRAAIVAIQAINITFS